MRPRLWSSLQNDSSQSFDLLHPKLRIATATSPSHEVHSDISSQINTKQKLGISALSNGDLGMGKCMKQAIPFYNVNDKLRAS